MKVLQRSVESCVFGRVQYYKDFECYSPVCASVHAF